MYKITAPEDQSKFVVPLNYNTELIYYDLRMIVDAPVSPPAEPRTWKATKINRLYANGVTMITLAQTQFNQFTDKPEFNPDGTVKGWWAGIGEKSQHEDDHKDNGSSIVPSMVNGEIKYSGVKPQLKVKGSYKNFYVVYDDEVLRNGEWKFEIDGQDASELVTTIIPENGVIKVRFIGDYSYIGKTMKLSYATLSLGVEIISL